jgi:hypothetical protein
MQAQRRKEGRLSHGEWLFENAPRNRGVSADRRDAIVPITAVIHTRASVGLHFAFIAPRLQKTSACHSYCTHTAPGAAACGHGADSGDRHEYAACLALTCICDSWRPSSAARMRMLRQASNIGSTTGASSLFSQMVASRRLGRIRRRLFGRSVPEDRFLWQEIAGYVSGLLFHLRTRRG